jgi:hypothetical protein
MGGLGSWYAPRISGPARPGYHGVRKGIPDGVKLGQIERVKHAHHDTLTHDAASGGSTLRPRKVSH